MSHISHRPHHLFGQRLCENKLRRLQVEAHTRSNTQGEKQTRGETNRGRDTHGEKNTQVGRGVSMLGGKYLNLKLFSDKKDCITKNSSESNLPSENTQIVRRNDKSHEVKERHFSRDKRIIHEGWLNKWTNIIGSYRPRYFVLENGILRYSIEKYSPTKETFVLSHCKIRVCPDDPLHFEIDTNEQGVLYLKADFPEDKHIWYISFKKAQLNYVHGNYKKKGCIDVNNFQISGNSDFLKNIIKSTRGSVGGIVSGDHCEVGAEGGDRDRIYDRGSDHSCNRSGALYGSCDSRGSGSKENGQWRERGNLVHGAKSINIDELFINSTDFEDKSPTLCLMENIVSLKEITRDLVKSSECKEAKAILNIIRADPTYKVNCNSLGTVLYHLSNSIEHIDAVIEKYIDCSEMLLKEENIQSKCMNKSLKILAKQNYFLEKSKDKKNLNNLDEKVKRKFEKVNFWENYQESEEEEEEGADEEGEDEDDLFFDCDEESLCDEKNSVQRVFQEKESLACTLSSCQNDTPESDDEDSEQEKHPPEGSPNHSLTAENHVERSSSPGGEIQEKDGKLSSRTTWHKKEDETALVEDPTCDASPGNRFTASEEGDRLLVELCNAKHKKSINFCEIDMYTDKSIKRRTKLPSPRTDIKISMWSLLKDCIGKDLSRIGMPIYLNEPSSFLQRLAEDFQYIYLLKYASEEVESTSRLAYVTAFTISPYASVIGRTFKPFNPLLGETYELTHRKFFFISEQVVHHPPITAYHCHNEYMENFASIIVNVHILGKSVEVTIPGSSHLILKYKKAKKGHQGCCSGKGDDINGITTCVSCKQERDDVTTKGANVRVRTWDKVRCKTEGETQSRPFCDTQKVENGGLCKERSTLGGLAGGAADNLKDDMAEYGQEHYTYQRASMIIHNIIFGKLWVELHGNILIRNHSNGDFSVVSYIRKGWFDKDMHKVRGIVCDRFKNVLFFIYGTWSQEIYIAYVKNMKRQEYSTYFFNEDGTENKKHFSRSKLNEFIDNFDWQFYEGKLDQLNSVCVWRAQKRPTNSELYYGFNRMTVELNEITPEYDRSNGAAIACTDSRFRPDQRNYENGNIEVAMTEKQRLENKQRVNSKKYTDKNTYKPRWFYKNKDPIYKDKDMYLFNHEYWVAKRNGTFTDSPDIF
ncbi:oxysterol-binding protein/PH domain containing protein [Plasmodium ovale curtisi]|uniref:Oxysterol-binding protein/PH domain containing protein n=1 Tax=Plasmodium ovale curtisi TaxID=864141 RepID=A0A1A8WHG9_PLAOA|nr:oxysterol-binding protein/PH domain containing protein [Plasmodium ovale curtisi]